MTDKPTDRQQARIEWQSLRDSYAATLANEPPEYVGMYYGDLARSIEYCDKVIADLTGE